ncbi:uncharacterized protein LOC123702220 isoform X2 [Colias croceus]|nr:uncharacterized protein LOC123702220 isoform X2 [Colias croceus]
MEVIRLREDAIPVCLPLHSHRPCVSQGEPVTSTVNKLDTTPVADVQNDSNMVPVEPQIPIMVMQSSAVNKADQFSLDIRNDSDLPCVSQGEPVTSTVNKLDPTPVADVQNDSNMVPVEPQMPIMVMQSSDVNKADQFSLVIRNDSDLLQVEHQVPIIAIQHIPSTSEVLEAKIKMLERKCGILTRKVRTLNEKVRRQKKKIDTFKSIIKDLKERN